MDLDVKALAVGLGVSWSSLILFTGWIAIFGWGTGFIEMMSSLYVGFAPAVIGGVIGAI